MFGQCSEWPLQTGFTLCASTWYFVIYRICEKASFKLPCLGTDLNFGLRVFIYFNTLCMWAVKTGYTAVHFSSDPLLLGDATSTKLLHIGSYIYSYPKQNMFQYHSFEYLQHMSLDARKSVFGGLRTTKVQTSLCICTVWSGPLLFA